MTGVEYAKQIAERITGWRRPSRAELAEAVRERRPDLFHFQDDGVIPNHPEWPLVIYDGAVRFEDGLDPAAVFEDLFQANGWGGSWRNGIYDYAHYHSRTHEVLGIARGQAKVRFGGDGGRTLDLKAGDVAVLAAGTGHQCLWASEDLLVVGAYPPSGAYDECTDKEEHGRALTAISGVPPPDKDPVYGSGGPLRESWKAAR